MDVFLVATLGALFGLIAGGLSGLWLMARSGPVATAKALNDLGSVRGEWEAWKRTAEGILEAVTDLEEVIERKRRRVAARESIEKAREAQGPDPNSRAGLLARARAQGHPV